VLKNPRPWGRAAGLTNRHSERGVLDGLVSAVRAGESPARVKLAKTSAPAWAVGTVSETWRRGRLVPCGPAPDYARC
jgi:hypothetical protein